MAAPIPLERRVYTSQYLSDLPGGKIIVECRRCDLRKRFDAMALLERIDVDCPLPVLLRKLRKGLGCTREINLKTFSDPPCCLIYDVGAMLDANAHLPTYMETRRLLLGRLKQE